MKRRLPFKRIGKWFMVAIVMAVLVAACAPATPAAPAPDINAIKTSVAYTVVAEITLTAAAFTPTPQLPSETPTPEISATPTTLVTDPTLIAQGTPGVLCDSMSFNPATVDVNIPDLTQMTPGQEFVKTWKVKNDGSCAWGDGYGLIYAYGQKMSGVPQPLGTLVEVGTEVDLSINFKAPDKVGEYVSAWQMTNASGIPFGKPLYVKIIVK